MKVSIGEKRPAFGGATESESLSKLRLEEFYTAIAVAMQNVLKNTVEGEKRRGVCANAVGVTQGKLLSDPNAVAVAIARGFSDYYKYQLVNQRIKDGAPTNE